MGKLILWGLGFLLAMELLRWMNANRTLMVAVFFVVIALSFFVWIMRNKERQEAEELARKIKFVSRGDFIAGQRTSRELGWVKVSGKSDTIAVEEALKVEGAKLGANALTKKHWRNRKESYVAGYGKKGNPYRKTRNLYDGEAFAVVVSDKRQQPPSKPTSVDVRKPARDKSILCVVDGSNIMYLDGQKPSLAPLRALVSGLKTKGLEYSIFFDANAPFLLLDEAKARQPELFMQMLVEETGTDLKHVSVVPGGVQADDFILSYAESSDGLVISNDNFRQYVDRFPWVKNEERTAKCLVHANRLLVPALGLDVALD
jgi:hypothetical protein